MSRVYRVSMFVTDIEGDNIIENLIKSGLNRYDLYPEFIEVEESEDFEWDDDLAINRCDSTKEDFEEYFK